MSKKVMGDFGYHTNAKHVKGDFHRNMDGTMGNDLVDFVKGALTKYQAPAQPQAINQAPPTIKPASKSVTMKYVTYVAVAALGVVAITYLLKAMRKK